ncbi:MAG: NUDIX hydrolase, partial [Nitrososphaera sp.]|nr:NUDIX hydrolase [Nitrososphaera sp.]
MVARLQIPVVMGCVIRDKAVLMVRRNSPAIPELHGKWELPGGKIEFTEDYTTACEREIYEETGVRTKVLRMLPVPYSAVRTMKDKTIHALVVCFQCVFLNDQAPPYVEKGIDRVDWIKLEDVDPLTTQAGTLFFLNYIRQKGTELQKLAADSNYNGVIRLACIDNSLNKFKEYRIILETQPTSDEKFKIQASWGRINTRTLRLK